MNGKEIQQTNRSRNKCGMTEFCHCEVPKARHHVSQYSCALSSHCEVPKARHHVSQYSCALSSHCEGATHVAIAHKIGNIFHVNAESLERPWQSQGRWN